MRVSEPMSGNVITIEDTASCREAIEHMVRNKIRHLPVVSHDGRLRGVVTDRDLRHYLFEPGIYERIEQGGVDSLLKAARVQEVMSAPALTVRPDEPLETAARVMRGEKIGSLPVIDHDRVVGMITETDLLRRLVVANACSTDVVEIVVSYP